MFGISIGHLLVIGVLGFGTYKSIKHFSESRGISTTQTSKNHLTYFLSLVGAVVGYALGYIILLNPIEEIGHRIFWMAIFNGAGPEMNFGAVFETTTFWKLLVSAGIGAGVGFYTSKQLSPKRSESASIERIDEKAA